jgi:hypothetical protein
MPVPRLERIVDHGRADAVLHAAERVEELELQQHVGEGAVGLGGAVETDERRVADRVNDGVIYLGHRIQG